MPMPYGPIPQQAGPLTHMPQQQMPHQQMPQQQMPPHHQPQYQPQYQPQPQQFAPQFLRPISPQQQQQIFQQIQSHRLPVPDQIMQAPRPEQQQQQQPQEVRIQLQRIPMPMRNEMSEPGVQVHEIPIDLSERNMANVPPHVQIQRIPLAVALQRAGITPDDLRNIQRMAEERIQQEFRQLAQSEDANGSSMPDSSDSSSSSTDEDESSSSNSDQLPQVMQIGRAAYGRSLVTPVRIPVNMMQQEDAEHEPAPADRPHCKFAGVVRAPGELRNLFIF